MKDATRKALGQVKSLDVAELGDTGIQITEFVVMSAYVGYASSAHSNPYIHTE